MTEQSKALGTPVDLVLGPLPPQRDGQYLTMTICGTSDDAAERGHWSSPAHVQWRINKAVAAERKRFQRIRVLADQCAEWHVGDGDECGEIARELRSLLRA